jgi:hypothetical protein
MWEIQCRLGSPLTGPITGGAWYCATVKTSSCGPRPGPSASAHDQETRLACLVDGVSSVSEVAAGCWVSSGASAADSPDVPGAGPASPPSGGRPRRGQPDRAAGADCPWGPRRGRFCRGGWPGARPLREPKMAVRPIVSSPAARRHNPRTDETLFRFSRRTPETVSAYNSIQRRGEQSQATGWRSQCALSATA